MPRTTPTPNDDTLRDTTQGAPGQPHPPKADLSNERRDQVRDLLDGIERVLDGDELPDEQQVERTAEQLRYDALQPEFREAVPETEFLSEAFRAEARANGFSRFQWAEVRTVVAQSFEWIKADEFVADGPRKLVVLGSIRFDVCGDLTALPEDLSVLGDMECFGCDALRRIPERLTVNGALNLSQCGRIRDIPASLAVRGNVFMTKCTSLEGMPASMHVRGDLTANDCTSLRALPKELRVDGTLSLRGCTALADLPDKLIVSRSADFIGCTSLAALPDDIAIGDYVMLLGCPPHVVEQARDLQDRGKIRGILL